MKKSFAILILSSFVSALFFTFMPFALAADETPVRIYYSEAIGGQKVYHVTVCNKMQAYAPVECVKEYQGNALFGNQCDAADDVGGRAIRGCVVREGNKPDGNTVYIQGTNYPKVSLEDYGFPFPQGCSDKPEQQGFLYGKQYAVVKNEIGPPAPGTDPFDDSKIERTVAIPDGIEFTPPAEKTKMEMYQAGTCLTWDYVDVNGTPTEDTFDAKTNPGGGTMEAAKALLAAVKAQSGGTAIPDFGAFTMLASDVISKGCNNNNGAYSKLNPGPIMASCSLMERLSGKSGSDVFAKYIGILYRWAAGIVGIVAVLIIVASGIQISAAGADTGSIDKAKARIIQAIVGLAILFSAGLILYSINPTYFRGG